MKKLALLLVVCVAFVFSANAQGTETPVEGIDWTGTPKWAKHEAFTVVAKGSTYEYAVQKHFTKTLAQIKAGTDGNLNRYYWEVLEVSVDDNDAPTMYNLVDTPHDFKDFSGVEQHFKELSWNQDVNKFYLIRVSEFANHADENGNTTSLSADLRTRKYSEILVKIGDVLNIHMIDNADNADAYLCSVDADPADMLAKFDTDFNATKFEFNGRPLTDGSFDVVLDVQTVKGTTLGTPEEVIINVPNAKLTYDATTGYYSANISLVDINTNMTAKLITDASVEDIYYVVTVKGYKHADTIGTYTNVTTSGEAGEKTVRTFGIYTTPKISKINHK